MNKRLLFFVFFILYISCSSGDEIYFIGNSMENNSKIVINGFVNADSGCIVNISRSIPAISQGQNLLDTLKIEGVHIILFENGDSIAELTKNSSNIKYQYVARQFVPKIGAQYKIRASAPNFSNCESEEETLLAKPILKDTSFFFNSNAAQNDPIGIFKFKIGDDININRFYEIEPYATSNSFSLSTSAQGLTSNNSTVLESNTVQDQAKTCSNSFFSNLSIIISNSCYNLNQILGYSVKATAQTIINGKNANNFKYVSLTVSSVPTSYFKFQKANETTSNSQYTYNVPNQLYTNIKGGYGIFYTKNAIRLSRQK